jgi:DNA-binding transcriptional regulator GbsR (MarR family)
VAHNSGTSIGAIAHRTGLAQSLVSKTVATMRDAGVFEVRPDPGDRRRVAVSVSPPSRDIFRARGDRPIERRSANSAPTRPMQRSSEPSSCWTNWQSFSGEAGLGHKNC